MGRGRAVVKYGLAGIVSALYGVTVYAEATRTPAEERELQKVAVVASLLVVVTCTIAAL